ncbi:MAG: hypothetical protein WC829_02295 [Hyphomicrobium sp.]|jgi:hypothetical protein
MIPAILAAAPWLGTAAAFVRSPLGKVLGIGVLSVSLLGYGYMKGAENAAAKCDAAALRVRIETLERDLSIAKAAELQAVAQEAAAEARQTTLNERLSSYESDLGATPPACLLTDDDVERLRNLTR